jgi:nicotinamide-nucleotide amidase
VTYANTAKERVLGVAPELLRGYGAVSPECVRAMAVGALRVSGADLALSVSGVAGPTGGSAERPVGMVFFALATDDHVEVVERRFQGDRAAVQRQAAYAALEMVRARCRGRMPARLPAGLRVARGDRARLRGVPARPARDAAPRGALGEPPSGRPGARLGG